MLTTVGGFSAVGGFNGVGRVRCLGSTGQVRTRWIAQTATWNYRSTIGTTAQCCVPNGDSVGRA